MKKMIKNLIACFMLFIVLITSIAYAKETIITDKKGREVSQTIRPTAPSTIDPDTNSDVSSNKYGSQDQNIISKATMIDPSSESKIYETTTYTLIRHTPSITNVEDNEYELINDTKTDRLKMKLKYTGVGVFDAKNGFYKVGGKTYYFDEDGLMVLGKAIDSIGNEYYFSYDTGELLYENQK